MRNFNPNPGFGSVYSAVTAMVSPAHQAITSKPLYEQVAPLNFNPGITIFLRKGLSLLGRWSRRIEERRALLSLDERMLTDLGIEPHQAREEAAKPFWRG